MDKISYIMTLATSRTGVEVFLTIRNIVGSGSAEYGRSGDFGNVQMWIVPKCKKSKEELVTKLQAVPLIQQISVVTLSNPIGSNELVEVRELFNSLNWDTSNVTDERLSLFLNAKLQGKYTYMLDFEHRKGRNTAKVRIIPAEEHPHFSPQWLVSEKPEEEILNRELTIDDLEIQTVVINRSSRHNLRHHHLPSTKSEHT
jgi:hypothetical protein